MRKITTLGLLMLISLFYLTAKAEINFDLTTVGGILTMDYDAVSTEKAKASTDRWITVVNFGNSGTAGKCGTATKTFDIKSGRTIEFYLEKCDSLVITANIASGRGLVVNIDAGANIALAGTGVCKDYVIAVNKDVPVKIKVQGKDSNSAWTSFFTFFYAPKVPSIVSFNIGTKSAVVDNDAKTITLELPYGTDISSVTPDVTLGGTAISYTPTGVQNFGNGPVTYTITDGTTPVDYTANITVKATPDTDKAITSLSINGRKAAIEETSGAISCDFPSFEGPLGNWPVVFTLNSETASANFTSGTNYNFSTNGTLSITVTAQDLSTKVYTVTPTISTKKNIGMLTANGVAEANDNLLLSAFSDYYISYLTASSTAPADINAFYANYDLIVLHSNVAGTNVTAVASKALVGVKPMLNLKAFFYNSGRWSWSTINPSGAVAGTSSADVETELQNHPIFANVNFTGTTLNYYDNLPSTLTTAIQYASDVATLDPSLTSHTIATVNSTGIQVHEIQNNATTKYLLVALSYESSAYSYFNSNAINVLKNSAAYLLNPTAKYEYPITSIDNVNGKSSIYYSNGFVNNPDQKSIVIYNSAGMKVLTSTDKSINTQSLSKGVYVIISKELQPIKFVK
ncbi:MAG: hypothetical protein PHS59_03515 [Paludibacter sp.]|nr:hypothetical protein [Paludibacter sp.]